MRKMLFIISITIILGFFISPVFATGNLGTAGSNLTSAGTAAGVTGKGLDNLGDLTGKIINAALGLIGLVFMVLMIYAGYLWMTARGQEEQVKKSQDIITASMIGLVVVLSAYAITVLVTGQLTNSGDGDTCTLSGGACRTSCITPGEEASSTLTCVGTPTPSCCVSKSTP